MGSERKFRVLYINSHIGESWASWKSLQTNRMTVGKVVFDYRKKFKNLVWNWKLRKVRDETGKAWSGGV